jgi:hypothetical protein
MAMPQSSADGMDVHYVRALKSVFSSEVFLTSAIATQNVVATWFSLK